MVELSITEIVDHLRSNGIGRNGNLMSGKAKQGNIREGTTGSMIFEQDRDF